MLNVQAYVFVEKHTLSSFLSLLLGMEFVAYVQKRPSGLR